MTQPAAQPAPVRIARYIDPPLPTFYITRDPDLLRRVVDGLQAETDATPDSTESQSFNPVTELEEESQCSTR